MSSRRQNDYRYFGNGRMSFFVRVLYVTSFPSPDIIVIILARSSHFSFSGIHSFVCTTGSQDCNCGNEIICSFLPLVFVGLLCSKACTLLVHSNCMEWVLPYYAVAYQILFHSLCLVQSDPEYVILPWMYDSSYIPIIWLVKIVANLLSHIVIFVLW